MSLVDKKHRFFPFYIKFPRYDLHRATRLFYHSRHRSHEGQTLETSAFQSRYGGQFTLSTPLINQIFVFHSPHRRSTTVSSETNPLYSFAVSLSLPRRGSHHPVPRAFFSLLPSLLVSLLGCFHYAKISGKFGWKFNGTVRTKRKITGPSGPPLEVVHLDRLDRRDRNLPFHFSQILVSSTALLRLIEFTNMAVTTCYQCSFCDYKSTDLSVLLMHPCSTISGT